MCHSADLKMWPFLKVLFVDCKSPLLRLKWVIVANASGLLNKILWFRASFRVFVLSSKCQQKFANIEVINLRWFAIINRLNEQKIIVLLLIRTQKRINVYEIMFENVQLITIFGSVWMRTKKFIPSYKMRVHETINTNLHM